LDLVTQLFDTSSFPARWYCGDWTPLHGWLHILSDLGVWSAYVAIPLVLGYFLVRRTDLPFRLVFLLFGAFILSCGTTHLMEAIIFWWPAYRLAGLIKLATALVSWTTVLALIRVAPQALAMRSPEELQREIDARIRAELELHKVNQDLERRVKDRTAELARTNATLHEERERFRTTLASIGDAVIATDTDGLVSYLNPVAQAMTGWSESETIGEPLRAVFTIVDEQTRGPVDYPASRVPWASAAAGRADSLVLISRSGAEYPIDESAAPIRDEEGLVAGAVLVFRDVTARRRADEALRRSEERYRLAAEAVNGIIYELDYRTGTVERSRGLLEVAGFRPDEVPATADWWSTRIHPDDLARARQLPEVPCDPDAARIVSEYRVRHKDGRWLHVVDRSVLLRDESGQPVRLVGCTQDVTERRRAEEALEQANRKKDKFLAVLAHELRNPLAPIRNALQVMRLAGRDGEVLGRVRGIMERQLGHMVRLVDDLLDVSRINHGKVELRTTRLDVSQVIESALETSRPAIDAAGHRLVVKLPPEGLRLSGDLTRLAQVVSNLLNNAAKYTPSGGNIELAVERQGREAAIAVRDDGIGMPPDMLPVIFDMFTQVDRDPERSQGGLGLGLTLVRKLVEMHGGTVEARSEGEGKGSEFVIRLPLLLDDAGRDGIDAVAPRFAPAHPPGRRILVVDDSRDSASSLAMLLGAMGNEVEVAGDGYSALALAPDFRPDVVLLDIGMPGMSGYEVARRMRQIPELRDAVMVAQTGWGQEEDRRRSAESGFEAHLVKPIDPAELEELMSRLPARPPGTARDPRQA
jgi:PAS domain S-box-containing protein